MASHADALSLLPPLPPLAEEDMKDVVAFNLDVLRARVLGMNMRFNVHCARMRAEGMPGVQEPTINTCTWLVNLSLPESNFLEVPV